MADVLDAGMDVPSVRPNRTLLSQLQPPSAFAIAASRVPHGVREGPSVFQDPRTGYREICTLGESFTNETTVPAALDEHPVTQELRSVHDIPATRPIFVLYIVALEDDLQISPMVSQSHNLLRTFSLTLTHQATHGQTALAGAVQSRTSASSTSDIPTLSNDVQAALTAQFPDLAADVQILLQRATENPRIGFAYNALQRMKKIKIVLTRLELPTKDDSNGSVEVSFKEPSGLTFRVTVTREDILNWAGFTKTSHKNQRSKLSKAFHVFNDLSHIVNHRTNSAQDEEVYQRVFDKELHEQLSALMADGPVLEMQGPALSSAQAAMVSRSLSGLETALNVYLLKRGKSVTQLPRLEHNF